jgi:hypothetical protein
MTVRAATPDALVVESFMGMTAATPLLDWATGKARPLPGAMAEERRVPEAGPGRREVIRDTLLTVAPDRKSAVTLDRLRTALRVWSWPAGELRKTLPLEPPDGTEFRFSSAAAFTPDGSQFIALMNYGKKLVPGAGMGSPGSLEDYRPYLERWDLAAGKRIDRTDLEARTAPVLIGNGSRLLVVRHGGEVRDAATG